MIVTVRLPRIPRMPILTIPPIIVIVPIPVIRAIIRIPWVVVDVPVYSRFIYPHT
jgi:hypothetical protein